MSCDRQLIRSVEIDTERQKDCRWVWSVEGSETRETLAQAPSVVGYVWGFRRCGSFQIRFVSRRVTAFGPTDFRGLSQTTSHSLLPIHLL
eukprot:2368090-Rhodomonas_salina.1